MSEKISIFLKFCWHLLEYERQDQLNHYHYFNKYFTMEYINLLLPIWHLMHLKLTFNPASVSSICKIVLVFN